MLSASPVDTVELERLPWDSEHFVFPVARLRGPRLPTAELEAALLTARERAIQLVYWSADPRQQVADRLLREFGGLRVDQRAAFERTLDPVPEPVPAAVMRNPDSFTVRELPTGRPSSELVELAIEAGVCSRFRIDPRIPREAAQRLYAVWMERSALREIADGVLVVSPSADPEHPLGLITLSARNSAGTIGLLAVAHASRGRGIGSLLLNSAHAWLARRGAQNVSVVTQLGNAPACGLYVKNGYRLADWKTNYHFWASEKG